MPITATTVTPDIEEITIVFNIERLNPILFSYDFFISTGIVPNTWELQSEPIINEIGSTIQFKNGLEIYTEPDSISFVQSIDNIPSNQIFFVDVAKNFLNTMTNAQFISISISPKIVVTFPEDVNSADVLLNNTILSSGDWKISGIDPRTTLSINFPLEDYDLNINVSSALFFESESIIYSSLLFIGNYYHGFPILKRQPQYDKAMLILNNWSTLIENFRNLIYTQFLNKIYSP
jgi:hypothetical protein